MYKNMQQALNRASFLTEKKGINVTVVVNNGGEWLYRKQDGSVFE